MSNSPTSGTDSASHSVPSRFSIEVQDVQEEADCWALELSLAPQDATLRAEFLQWLQQSSQHQQAWERAVLDCKNSELDLRLYAQQHPQSLKKMPRRWFLGAGLSVAAGAAIWGISPFGMGLQQAWQQWGADYHTQTGERKVLQLAPSLSVQLNTQSALSVSAQTERVALTLHSGELALQTHNHWCEVTAAEGLIQVFNADLEVRQVSKKQLQVHCRHGWAQVSWQGTDYALQAGQTADFHLGDKMQLSHEDTPSNSWREGFLVFHEQPLQEVIDEVNRYRPGRIVLLNQKYAQRRFSANLLLDDINQFIEQLRAQPGWQVRQVGDYVWLS